MIIDKIWEISENFQEKIDCEFGCAGIWIENPKNPDINFEKISLGIINYLIIIMLFFKLILVIFFFKS